MSKSLTKICPIEKNLLTCLQTDRFLMMSKAEITRQRIIKEAADIFNQHGYAGSSISDVMKATGLKKGGIYNHFASKDELAFAAFDYAQEQLQRLYSQALKGKRHAVDRLKAIVSTFCAVIENPPIKGGCPILNTAIESDDTHPALRLRAQKAMNELKAMIIKVILLGIKKGEINASVDAENAAIILISLLEGALMMSKLYDDRSHLYIAKEHLFHYIETMT